MAFNAHKNQDAYQRFGNDAVGFGKSVLNFLILDDLNVLRNPHEEGWKRAVAGVNIVLDVIGPEGRCGWIIGKSLIGVVEKVEVPIIAKALRELIEKKEYAKVVQYFEMNGDKLSGGMKNILSSLLDIPEVQRLLEKVKDIAVKVLDVLEKPHDLLVKAGILPSMNLSAYKALSLQELAAAAFVIHSTFKSLRDTDGYGSIHLVQGLYNDIRGVIREAITPPSHQLHFDYPIVRRLTQAETIGDERNPSPDHQLSFQNPGWPIGQSFDGGKSWEKIENGKGIMCKIESVKNGIVTALSPWGVRVFQQQNLEFNGMSPSHHIGQLFYFGNDNYGHPLIQAQDEHLQIQREMQHARDGHSWTR